MSKQDEDDTDLAGDDASFDDAAAGAADDAETGRPAPKRGIGARVAWLASLLAIVALVVAGYFAFTDWSEERRAGQRSDPLLDLRSRIANSEETLDRFDSVLTDLEAADAGTADQLDQLREHIDERLERLDSLPTRVANLESSLSSLQGISTGARNRWLLAEAESYLQIANAQLQLANNPRLATLALGMADERVAQLGDPALTDVRGAIADELAALDGMDETDIEGVTLTLASLARVVDSLPVRPARSEAAATVAAGDAGGLERAWASVKSMFGGLVKHSRPGDTATPLVTPEAEYFLRTNLTLQLQAARLALLSGEPSVFRQSLDDAASWIDQYFDPATTPVTSALETIAEIRDSVVTSAKPDISESLRLLRQFRTMTESAQ